MRSHQPVTGNGGCDCAASAACSEGWSTITAGVPFPALGKARIVATSSTGTVALPTGSETTWPTRLLAAARNVRVAMAGSGPEGYPAVSASCPATGTGTAPAFWMSNPVPTLKVSAADSGRHALTAGLMPIACGSASPAAAAVACHRGSMPPGRVATVNGAGKPPEPRGETASARTSSVARAAAIGACVCLPAAVPRDDRGKGGNL